MYRDDSWGTFGVFESASVSHAFCFSVPEALIPQSIDPTEHWSHKSFVPVASIPRSIDLIHGALIPLRIRYARSFINSYNMLSIKRYCPVVCVVNRSWGPYPRGEPERLVRPREHLHYNGPVVWQARTHWQAPAQAARGGAQGARVLTDDTCTGHYWRLPHT